MNPIPKRLINADLLLVGEKKDGILAAVSAVCDSRGVNCVTLTRHDFCQLVSVYHDGTVAHVVPDLPVILRCSSFHAPISSEDKFLMMEERAQIWAACNLMRSVVVNRPTIDGTQDDGSQGLQIKLLCSPPALSRLVPAEIYSSVSPCDTNCFELVYFEDTFCPTQNDLETTHAGGSRPYRARERLPVGWVYLQVIVVGKSVWIRNDCYGNLDWLRQLTLAMTVALGLNFAVLYWRSRPLHRRAEIARVTCYPSANQLGGYLSVVAEALVDLCVT